MTIIFNKFYSLLQTILKYTNITEAKKVPTNHLPLELESEILLRLPTKDLVRCRCTSKRWRDEIDKPYFTKSYTDRKKSDTNNKSIIIYVSCENLALSLDFHDYSPCNNYNEVENKLARHHILFDHLYPIELVGSCNGLICFRVRQRNDDFTIKRFMLHNPVTGKYYTIPPLLVKREPTNLLNMIGFGYDSISDDYKILISFMLISGPHVSYEYSVYSLKANSWKKIEPRLKVVVIPGYKPYYMVLSNNSLHCVGYDEDTKAKGIYGFDLRTEEFREIPQPNFGYNEDYLNCVLAVLKGCLHLATYYRTNNNNNNTIELDCSMAIWVMKEYGSQLSWTKVIDHISVKKLVQTTGLQYNVNYKDTYYHYHVSHLSSPLAYSEDGLEILIGVGYPQGECVKGFVRCDVRNGELKKFEIRGFASGDCSSGGYCQVMPWSGSLVQLPSTNFST